MASQTEMKPRAPRTTGGQPWCLPWSRPPGSCGGAALGLLAATCMLVAGCQPSGPAAPAAAPPRAVAPTPTSAAAAWVKVRAGLGTPLYEVPAQVLSAPGSIAEIMAPLRAQVVAIHVRPGQRVGAQAPVLTVIFPEVLRAAFAQQGAGLRLQAYVQRREQLLQLKGDGLLRLSDLAETDARIAEAKAAQLEAQAVLQVAGLSASEAAALGSRDGRVTLRSPIAGVVTSVTAALGQVTDGGSALVRVVGSSEPRIEARLPPALPEAVGFTLRLASGAARPLRLLERAPLVDSRDGTALAWLVPMPPPASPAAVDLELPAGLTAKLQVFLAAPGPQGAATGPSPVLVPARALLIRDGHPHIVRRRDSRPEQVAVRVLLVTGADALVLALTEPPLQPGDEVAADAGPYAAADEAGEP